MMTVKAFVIWIGILVLAIVNGALREFLLTPILGTTPALVVSGVLLSILVLCVSYISLPWLQVRRRVHFWYIGIGWLGLTLCFEFAFGLWQGKSWSEMLDVYTFKDGNVWPLVLFVTALAPYITDKMRSWGGNG